MLRRLIRRCSRQQRRRLTAQLANPPADRPAAGRPTRTARRKGRCRSAVRCPMTSLTRSGRSRLRPSSDRGSSRSDGQRMRSVRSSPPMRCGLGRYRRWPCATCDALTGKMPCSGWSDRRLNASKSHRGVVTVSQAEFAIFNPSDGSASAEAPRPAGARERLPQIRRICSRTRLRASRWNHCVWGSSRLSRCINQELPQGHQSLRRCAAEDACCRQRRCCHRQIQRSH